MARVTGMVGRICVVGAALALLLVVALAASACGAGAGAPVGEQTATTEVTTTVRSGATAGSVAEMSSTTTVPGPLTTSSTGAPTTEASDEATSDTVVLAGPVTEEDLYARIAAAVQPLRVFAPTALPEGASLARHWLPVIGSTDPTHSTPARSNPYIVGRADDAEVQVVYELGAGWLVVVENFQGDLGDVSGKEAGKVDGIPATLYEVNGGELVQWSFDGKWYGVFGRDVPEDAILATALGMVQASAESL
jgi:hypothetical protein